MRESWKYRCLTDISTKIVDGSHNPPTGVEYSEYPMLSSKNIEFDKIDYSNPRYLTKEQFEAENKRTDVSEGDVLLTIVGTVGRACCITRPFKNFTLQRSVAIIKPKAEIVCSRYLMHCLTSMRDVFDKEAKGVAQKGIYLKQLGNIKIPVPPLPEQERIVAELDLLTGIIDKQKAQLQELDTLAQSIFYDMFGDPERNDKEWDVKKLSDIGKVITGNTPSTKDDKNYSSNDYCFVKPSDIARDGISIISDSEYHISAYGYENSRKLPKGSILTTCIGIVGKVGILSISATCNQQINAIVPKESLESLYVAYCIIGKRKTLESMANAPVVPIINKGDFSNISIPVPPLSLQQSFAQKIQSIESQKASINRSIAETQKLFDYTMDKYFG